MSDHKPDWVVGYTTRNHLIIDLDNTSHYKVRCLVKLLMQQYPEIGDCLILRSSQNTYKEKWNYPVLQNPKLITVRDNYHVVFNNKLSYEECCKIIENLAYLGAINEDYVNIRNMRQDMTLRVSEIVNTFNVKPKPQFTEYIENPYCKTNGKGIYSYNRLRRLFL